MTAPDRSTLTHFDHWLDGLVSGMPAPEIDTASDSTIDPATSRDARNAARQFHELAARADRTTHEIATNARLDTIWEDIMDAQLAQPVTVSGNTAPGALRDLRPGAGRVVASDRSPVPLTRFQPVINSMLAAALILALATGILRAGGGFDLRFGNGDNDGNGSPTQLAGLVTQVATPATPEVLARVELPTAADCTVEPLTVDQVLEIYQDPVGTYLRNQSTGVREPTPADVAAVVQSRAEATALADLGKPVPQEIMNEVISAQRQWTACVIKGAYFQAWALTFPGTVQEELRNILPPSASLNEARAALEELEETGNIGGVPPISGRYNADTVLLINPESSQARLSRSLDGNVQMVSSGYVAYNSEGGPFGTSPFPDMTPDSGYKPWRVVSIGENGPWLIDSVGAFLG